MVPSNNRGIANEYKSELWSPQPLQSCPQTAWRIHNHISKKYNEESLLVLYHTRVILKQDLQNVWHYMVKDEEKQAVVAKNIFNVLTGD